jgi:hypothetical protein
MTAREASLLTVNSSLFLINPATMCELNRLEIIAPHNNYRFNNDTDNNEDMSDIRACFVYTFDVRFDAAPAPISN